MLYLLLYILGFGPGGGIWGLGWSLVVANRIHLDCVICIPKLNTHDKHVLVAASLTFKINIILKSEASSCLLSNIWFFCVHNLDKT